MENNIPKRMMAMSGTTGNRLIGCGASASFFHDIRDAFRYQRKSWCHHMSLKKKRWFSLWKIDDFFFFFLLLTPWPDPSGKGPDRLHGTPQRVPHNRENPRVIKMRDAILKKKKEGRKRNICRKKYTFSGLFFFRIFFSFFGRRSTWVDERDWHSRVYTIHSIVSFFTRYIIRRWILFLEMYLSYLKKKKKLFSAVTVYIFISVTFYYPCACCRVSTIWITDRIRCWCWPKSNNPDVTKCTNNAIKEVMAKPTEAATAAIGIKDWIMANCGRRAAAIRTIRTIMRKRLTADTANSKRSGKSIKTPALTPAPIWSIKSASRIGRPSFQRRRKSRITITVRCATLAIPIWNRNRHEPVEVATEDTLHGTNPRPTRCRVAPVQPPEWALSAGKRHRTIFLSRLEFFILMIIIWEVEDSAH